MPNWCSNNVTLKSNKKQLDFLEDIDFDLSFIINWEVGDNVKDLWGTSQYNQPLLYRKSDEELIVSFESAWTPPDLIYKELINMGINVNATYVEIGCSFFGYYTTKGKELVENLYDIPELSNEDDDREKCLNVFKRCFDCYDLEILEGEIEFIIENHLENLDEEQ